MNSAVGGDDIRRSGLLSGDSSRRRTGGLPMQKNDPAASKEVMVRIYTFLATLLQVSLWSYIVMLCYLLIP